MRQSAVSSRDETNTTVFPSLVEESAPIVANFSDTFVVAEDVSWEKMQELVGEYCEIHDHIIRSLFLAPAVESGRNFASSRVKNWQGDPLLLANLNSPYVLRIKGVYRNRGPKLRPRPMMASPAVIEDAVETLGLIFNDSPYASAFWSVLDAPATIQNKVAEYILSPRSVREMDWAHSLNKFELAASARVMELSESSASTFDFLNAVAATVLDWISSDFRSNQQGNKENGLDSPDRPLAVAWFSIWLAERGVWWFPAKVGPRVTELVPFTWRIFRHGLIAPGVTEEWVARERQLAELSFRKAFAKEDAAAQDKALERSRSALAYLRWISTWRDVKQASADFLSEALSALPPQGRLELRGVWDISKLEIKGLTPVQLRSEEAKLRANKVRKGGRGSSIAWPWVDDPTYEPYRKAEKYLSRGCNAGPNLLKHVAELRRLLPKLSGKHVWHWTHSLGVWLMYLATLSDEDVPGCLLDIDRNKHIDAPGEPAAGTLNAFTREQKLPPELQVRVVNKLEAAWNAAYDLAAPDQRPPTRVCPVLRRFDAPKLKSSNCGQTHRRPLDEEILLLLIAENRKNDFEFSRTRTSKQDGGRLLDHVRINDREVGQVRYEWFPGYAVLMDVLLNIPLRKKQARYLDSGEGDEYWIDIETLELRRNPLPIAEVGRQSCFLRRHLVSILEDKPVLGMFINTNKTGASYEVPWLPKEVALNVKRVIDWQLLFNPIDEAVPDRDYKAYNQVIEDIFSEPVWPIFRDPVDPSHQPISEGKLQKYFEALMAHCERILNSGGDRNISLFSDQVASRGSGKGNIIRKPIIDIHSLRVTGVTVLLENGVPLEVVRLLVGHASIAMTCYYHVIESRKVHEDLMKAIESRAPTIERLQRMTIEEFREWSDKFVFNRTNEPFLALNMVGEAIRNHIPGWDLKYHGICAGGDCRYGGAPEKEGGHATPLWRAEACSLCRYRVTGAPWLVGIVYHVNELWWELRECTKNVMELQMRRDAAEDEGRSVRSIAGDLERAKIKRDHLFDEWANELRYAEQAKKDLEEWASWIDSVDANGNGDSLNMPAPLRSPLGEDGVKVQLKMVHELSQMTELLRVARILPSAIPLRGLKEDRNAILLEIARASGLAMPLLRLSRKDAEQALDAFADLILDAFSEPDEIEDLVRGRVPLRQFPELQRRIVALLGHDGGGALLTYDGITSIERSG